MNEQQEKAYKEFSQAFGISFHTLAAAFLSAKENFNVERYGTMAQEQVVEVVDIICPDKD